MVNASRLLKSGRMRRGVPRTLCSQCVTSGASLCVPIHNGQTEALRVQLHPVTLNLKE